MLAAALGAAGGASAQAPAPAAPPPPPAAASVPAAQTAAAAQTQGRQGKKMDNGVKAANPDIAVLEYLGEYGDAADGLDPMGLADPDSSPVKSGDGKG